MRILNIAEMYPPSIGGIERHVRTTALELGARGHEVVVATQQTGTLPEEMMEPNGVRVVRLDSSMQAFGYKHRDAKRRYHPSFTDPLLMLGLRRLVREWRPDVVIGHDWMLQSYLPLKKNVGAPVISVLHDYHIVCPKRTLVTANGCICDGPRNCVRCARSQYKGPVALGMTLGLRVSRSLWLNQIDQFIAVSEKIASVARLVVGDKPMSVIPSCVPDNLASFVEDEPRPSFLPDGDFILFVGALGRNKGIYVLLDAYSRLGMDIPLVLLGARKPDTPGIWPPGITVVEDVPHNKVMAAWRDCTIGVVPSIWAEPLGLVAVEAASMSKAVVASAVGGLNDIIVHDVTGRLVEPGDSAALAADIRFLLEDEITRQRMGEAAAQRAPRFTVTAVVDSLLNVLTGLAALS